MSTDVKTIKIDEVEYIRKDCVHQRAHQLDGMEYVVIRTYSAGVHVGYLQKRAGKESVLVNSRRIHYWAGAASLSQLATDGVSKPKSCRFSVPVSKITLTETIEIIPCTLKAQESIEEVPQWKV